jgi:hypothetical protein
MRVSSRLFFLPLYPSYNINNMRNENQQETIPREFRGVRATLWLGPGYEELKIWAEGGVGQRSELERKFTMLNPHAKTHLRDTLHPSSSKSFELPEVATPLEEIDGAFSAPGKSSSSSSSASAGKEGGSGGLARAVEGDPRASRVSVTCHIKGLPLTETNFPYLAVDIKVRGGGAGEVRGARRSTSTSMVHPP